MNTRNREQIEATNHWGNGCISLHFKGKSVRLDPISAANIARVYGNDIDDWVGKFVDLVATPGWYGVDVRPVEPPVKTSSTTNPRIINPA